MSTEDTVVGMYDGVECECFQFDKGQSQISFFCVIEKAKNKFG